MQHSALLQELAQENKKSIKLNMDILKTKRLATLKRINLVMSRLRLDDWTFDIDAAILNAALNMTNLLTHNC